MVLGLGTDLMKKMDLASLGKGMRGLSPACGATLAESASVCLEHNAHRIGVSLSVVGTQHQAFQLEWAAVNEQQRRTYNDLQEATEQGACGLAILIVKEFTGLVVAQRLRKGAGFDYWLGEDVASDENEPPLAGKTRLEVSGILAGKASDITSRIKQKKKQITPSNHMGAGCVAVVEFSSPVAHVEIQETQ